MLALIFIHEFKQLFTFFYSHRNIWVIFAADLKYIWNRWQIIFCSEKKNGILRFVFIAEYKLFGIKMNSIELSLVHWNMWQCYCVVKIQYFIIFYGGVFFTVHQANSVHSSQHTAA